MKNGVYLFLILFLGIMGYFVVNDLFYENTMSASIIFLIVSAVITILTTHFRKKERLIPAQKAINIIYIGLFTLYGIALGTILLFTPSTEMANVKFEGGIFMGASAVLIYGLYVFIKSRVIKHI